MSRYCRLKMMKILRVLRKEIFRDWRGYLLAVALVALATWLKILAQPSIIPADVPILYLLAIVPTAIFFGLGPSILVSILSLLAYDFFFIAPLHEFNLTHYQNAPILLIFIVVGVLFSYLASNLRQKNQIAAREISARKQTEIELVKHRDHLEELVKQRTNELERSNQNLTDEISERKKAQESLRESERRWATTLASIGDGVIATDITGRITFMNFAAEALTGWTLRESINKLIVEIFNIVDEKTRLKLDNPVAKVIEKGIIVGLANHTILIRRDGSEIAIGDSGAPIKAEDGNTTGVVLVFRDITERQKAEEELKRYTMALEIANKELESFSYSVSHDLKAPLRTMDGFSEIVLQDYGDKLDETARDYLGRIRKASQMMSQLIDSMLKLSRINRAEMLEEKVNLSEMARSIYDDLEATQPERKADFVIASEITVNGDRHLLQILMQNLLENAWKFTGKCLLTRLELGVTQQEGKRIYFVKDNGVGFDMKYAERLFQPFQRLHNVAEYPGSGIGLAIAQRVIQRHGGRIWAQSEIDKGTTFFFTLD